MSAPLPNVMPAARGTAGGSASVPPTWREHAWVVEHNLLLSRALEQVQQGRIDRAAAVLADAPGQPLSLQDVFAVYHAEVEATLANLRDAQLRLEQSLDRFAWLFRSLPVAALMVDAEGHVHDANSEALALLALDRALRAVKVPLRRMLVDPTDELRLSAVMRQLSPQASQRLDDVPMRTLDGQHTLWVDMRLCLLPPLPDSHDLPQVLCVLNDVTARHQAQQAEQARERAEAASLAKSRLLSRISHELRTPLNAVIGFSHLMLMPTSSMDDTARHRLQMIQQAGEQLLALVNDVLDINAAEHGRLSLALQPVDLALALSKVMPLHAVDAQAAGVRLEMGAWPPGERGPRVMADERRLREVLHNLISNAIKYNQPGGSVLLTCEPQGPWVSLQVRDSGRGMAASQLEHLFEPFNRLGAERTRVGGTGLGLSISQALVQAMGGEIEVASTVGEGSTFTVRLRAA